jgi:sulfate permease, SulP family
VNAPIVASSHVVRIFPILGQLATYQRAWLGSDVLAGLSVAAVALPSAIAYPAIADLPVEAGLFAAILPAVGYALFGPSRQLMVGPDTGTTIMLASFLLQLGVVGADQRVVAAAALALLVGLLYLVAGFARFGFVANFLSRPVLLGFLAGIALSLLIGQIGRLTRVSIESEGFIRPLREFASKLGQAHLLTVLIGLGLFILLRVMRRLAPRFPGPLAAIVIGVALAFVADFPDKGIEVVGSIRAVMPRPELRWPDGVALDDLVLAAFGILLVSYGSGIITARSFGAKNHYDVDGDRELIGFGAANIASGLFGGFPVTSSDSRTAVNDAVGGKTQLAGLVSAAALAGMVFFIGGVFAYLPVAALGAVLASAAVDLIDVRAFSRLWRLSHIEFLLALATALGVVTFGVLHGVLLAVAATLAHLVWLNSQPRDALLGCIPGRHGLFKLHHHPDARPLPGLTIYLVQASLVFLNADHVKHRIFEIVDGLPEAPEWFILDASAINHLDTSAAEALDDVWTALAERSIRFGIADLHSRPRGMIERSGLGGRIGPDMHFETAEAAFDAFQARTKANGGHGRQIGARDGQV